MKKAYSDVSSDFHLCILYAFLMTSVVHNFFLKFVTKTMLTHALSL